MTRDLLHTMLQGIVYILTNKHNTTLYTGVTRDLRRRVAEHKLHINQGFTAKYNIEKLVYYEVFDRLDDGVHREKQLKKWHRDWKERLINDFNPEWKDLAEAIGVDAEYIQAVCGGDLYEIVPVDSDYEVKTPESKYTKEQETKKEAIAKSEITRIFFDMLASFFCNSGSGI